MFTFPRCGNKREQIESRPTVEKAKRKINVKFSTTNTNTLNHVVIVDFKT